MKACLLLFGSWPLLLVGCAMEPPSEPLQPEVSQTQAALEGLPLPRQGVEACRRCMIDAQGGSDCPAPTECASSGANNDLRYCSPLCDDADDCAPDHVCVIGLCRPALSQGCNPDFPNQIWTVDSCGGSVSPVRGCPAGTLCDGGRCREGRPGDRCDQAQVIQPVRQLIQDSLDGYLDDGQGSCGGVGPDRAYTFTIPPGPAVPYSFMIRGYDAVLHLRRGCDGAEVACNDDHDPPGAGGSRISGALEPGDYVLFVDAFGNQEAPFQLAIDFGEACPPAPCALGSRSCVGDSVQICERGPDGCPVLGDPTPCGAGQRCLNGVCGNVCLPPACEPGAVRCAGPGGTQTCGADAQGCIVWQDARPCPGGQRCDNGQCGGCPPAPCEVGETVCEGIFVRRCAVSGDGCVRMQGAEPCPEGQFCQGDRCGAACPPAPCMPGERRCVGDVVQTCGVDAGGCRAWVDAQRCGAGQQCVAGQCANACQDECAPGAQRCANAASVERCVRGAGGCAVWQPSQRCLGNTTCQAGACVDRCGPPPCQPGARECRGNAVRGCGVNDQGCVAWGQAVPCAAGLICEAGSCVAEPPPPPRPEGDTCGGSPALIPEDQPLSGQMASFRADVEAGCAPGDWPDRFWRFSLQEPTRLAIRLASPEDEAAVGVFRGCPSGAGEGLLACGTTEFPLDAGLPPGDYALVIWAPERFGAALAFRPVCEDECEADARICLDGFTEALCSVGPDGCLSFFERPCASDERCEGNRCRRPNQPDPDGGFVPRDAGVDLDGGAGMGGMGGSGGFGGGFGGAGGGLGGGAAPDSGPAGGGPGQMVDADLVRPDGELLMPGDRATPRGGRGCDATGGPEAGAAGGSAPWLGLLVLAGLWRRRRQKGYRA